LEVPQMAEQFGKFGQRDCAYQINPDPRGTAIPFRFGQSNGGHHERSQERKKPYALLRVCRAHVHSQYRMPDSPILRLC
jgi:hypothetical protein